MAIEILSHLKLRIAPVDPEDVARKADILGAGPMLLLSAPPDPGDLDEGQLALELSDPGPRLWVGVPATYDPDEVVLLLGPPVPQMIVWQDDNGVAISWVNSAGDPTPIEWRE